MHAMDIARKLRHLVFDASTGQYNNSLDISVCETILMAACALEEQAVDLDAERSKRRIDNAFLEHACKAALHDLKQVVTRHMLCDCCRHIMPDGECGSPCEHEANCWMWRGVCEENGGKSDAPMAQRKE